MSEELKSCPFCGNEPWGIFGPNEEGACFVECHGTPSLMCGHWHYVAESENMNEAREETRKAWNTRVEK